jgi:hypothetical protein
MQVEDTDAPVVALALPAGHDVQLEAPAEFA